MLPAEAALGGGAGWFAHKVPLRNGMVGSPIRKETVVGFVTESQIRDEAKKAAKRQEELLTALLEEQRRTNGLLEQLLASSRG